MLAHSLFDSSWLQSWGHLSFPKTTLGPVFPGKPDIMLVSVVVLVLASDSIANDAAGVKRPGICKLEGAEA